MAFVLVVVVASTCRPLLLLFFSSLFLKDKKQQQQATGFATRWASRFACVSSVRRLQSPTMKPTIQPLSTKNKPLVPQYQSGVGDTGIRHGHDEMNLALLPLVFLAKRPPADQPIKYEADAPHPQCADQSVKREVTITGAIGFGLPTAQDEDVLIALLYLTLSGKHAKGFRLDGDDNGTFRFTRAQLLHTLGWPDTGPYYERLKKSLRLWKCVTIFYKNWWDSKTGHFVTYEDGFNLIDSFKLIDGRRRAKENQPPLPFFDDEARDYCCITWSKMLFANFKNGYVKTLNIDKLFSLPTHAAKRAYRYLDAFLPSTLAACEFDLETFACQHVGISKNYKPSRLRAEVQKTVVEPLEQADVIEKLPPEQRFLKREKSDRIVFQRTAASLRFLTGPAVDARAGSSATPPPPAEPGTVGDLLLVAELRRHHLGGKAAHKFVFVEKRPAAYLEAKIDFLDFLIETGASPKNPAGWLKEAIEADYGAPAGYVSKGERQRRHAEEAERRQRLEEVARQKEEAARRKEAEQEAARQAQRHHIDGYLAGLAAGERAALEQRAFGKASEFERGYLRRGGPTGEAIRQSLIDAEVLRLHPLAKPESAADESRKFGAHA